VGRRSLRMEVKSAMLDDDDTGTQKVDGSPRPGKDERRMLIVEGAMLGESEVPGAPSTCAELGAQDCPAYR
jgi:hypothetical protein